MVWLGYVSPTPITNFGNFSFFHDYISGGFFLLFFLRRSPQGYDVQAHASPQVQGGHLPWRPHRHRSQGLGRSQGRRTVEGKRSLQEHHRQKNQVCCDCYLAWLTQVFRKLQYGNEIIITQIAVFMHLTLSSQSFS